MNTAVRSSLSEETAAEIRALLARRRISVSEFARRLGWAQSYMARRIDGRVALDLNDLAAISEALDVPLTTLLPAPFRPNDRSPASPVRATKPARPAPTRPKSRPANASTRPQSSAPPTRRRPARIDRAAGR